MSRHDISDERWGRISHLLPGRPGLVGGIAKDNRRFINAILYVAKTGIAWRDLPSEYGKWDTVYHRYNEWCKRDRWQRIFDALQDPDLEWLLIDSTVIRAHQHAAGMNTGGADEDLGRSQGGFGTKIHGGFDALGNPARLHLSPGQDADITHAEAVIGDLTPGAVLADKGYDSDAFVESLQKRGIEVVIPPKKNRVAPRVYDKVLYKERNKAERGFNRLKQFRRVATRYEKRSRNFLAMVLVAAITILLL
jgi:transposase